MMLCDEPFAPTTTMPAAMTKNEPKKTRNRDDASVRFEFAIMERAKSIPFYPKAQKTVKPFRRDVATTAFVASRKTEPDGKILSPFVRDAAATDARQRPGFQISTRDACVTLSIAC